MQIPPTHEVSENYVPLRQGSLYKLAYLNPREDDVAGSGALLFGLFLRSPKEFFFDDALLRNTEST